MADVTRADILKLAKLAKLDLSDQEADQFTTEIDEVLGYVKQLQSVKLDGVEPTYQVTGLTTVTRPDELIDYQAKPKDLLKNVPAVKDGQIKVKRVL